MDKPEIPVEPPPQPPEKMPDFMPFIVLAALLGLLLLASACEQPGPTEPEATRTHALLRVERSSQASGMGVS